MPPRVKSSPKKKALRCKHCGVKNIKVKTMDDLYYSDLYNKSVRVKLCPKCAKESADAL